MIYFNSHERLSNHKVVNLMEATFSSAWMHLSISWN